MYSHKIDKSLIDNMNQAVLLPIPDGTSLKEFCDSLSKMNQFKDLHIKKVIVNDNVLFLSNATKCQRSSYS